MRRAIVKAKCYSPIGLDRHRIAAAPVAGQRVKPKHGKRHVFRAVGCFQCRKNLLRLVHQIRPDAATVIRFIQPPQTLVFESPDHATLSLVYSETLRYTSKRALSSSAEQVCGAGVRSRSAEQGKKLAGLVDSR